MTQLRIKLNINKNHYSIEQSKLAYALSCLKKRALKQLQSYLKKDENIALADMKAFYIKLQLIFDDLDRKTIAQRKLRQLRQKNKEFYLYLFDYQRLVLDIDFDDEVKRFILLNDLSDELKFALITVNLFISLNDIIQILQKIDNRFRFVQAFIRKSFSYDSSRSFFVSFTSIIKISFIFSTSVPRLAFISSANTNVMNLSIFRRRDFIISTKRSRRMNEELCMYCEESEHFVNFCSIFKKKSKVRTYELNTMTSKKKKKVQSSI